MTLHTLNREFNLECEMDRRIFLQGAGATVLSSALPSKSSANTSRKGGENTSATVRNSLKQSKNPPSEGLICRVVSVGGAGNRIVADMRHRLFDVDRIIAIDNDSYALNLISADEKILLNSNRDSLNDFTRSDPAIAAELARMSRKQIECAMTGAQVVFIVAGLGGGTGSGVAPVVAEIAKECLGPESLVIAVAATPFKADGVKKMMVANRSLERLRYAADAVIEIPNAKLFDSLWKEHGNAWQSNRKAVLSEYYDYSHRIFGEAYDALAYSVNRASEMPIGIDLEDIRTVVTGTTIAPIVTVGWGEATGKKSALLAAQNACNDHPLLGVEKISAISRMHVAFAGKMSLNDLRDALFWLRENVKENALITLSIIPRHFPVTGTKVSIAVVGDEI